MSNIKVFENRKVRTQWDAEKEDWWFSVVDIVGILTDKDYEADVNMELHEKPFSILMRLEKNKQLNTDHNHTKYRNHEQER